MSNERKEEEAKNEKLKAEEETLKKELSDLDGLLVKEKSRFRNFLEEKFDFDMGLWLGEDTPGADTLDIVSYLLAFVFLAGLIALSIVSGISSPFILPLAITTLVVLLYGFYRTVMPRQKWATNEQAAFIRLLGGDKLQIGERISEGLLCSFQAGFKPVDKEPNYVRLIENNDRRENFLNFAVTHVTPTALDSFIQHPLGKRIANFLINHPRNKYDHLRNTYLLGLIIMNSKMDINEKFSETGEQLITILLETDLIRYPKSIVGFPLLILCDNDLFLTDDPIRWRVAKLLINKISTKNADCELLRESREILIVVCYELEKMLKYERDNAANDSKEKKEILEKINKKVLEIDYQLLAVQKKSGENKTSEDLVNTPGTSRSEKPSSEPSSSASLFFTNIPNDFKVAYKKFLKSSREEKETQIDLWEKENCLKILAFAFQNENAATLDTLIERFKKLNYFSEVNVSVKFEEKGAQSPLLTWVINPVRLKKLKGEEIIAKVKALIDIGALVTGTDESGHHPLSLLTVPTKDLLGLDPKLVSNLVALLIKEDNTNSYTTIPALKSMLEKVGEMYNNEPLKLELQIAFYGELIRREVISADDKSIPEEVQKSLDQSHPPSSSP